MLEFTSYIMDVQEAKEQLIDIVNSYYKPNESVDIDDLMDNISQQLQDDGVYGYEATKFINRYGLDTAINDLVEYDVDLNDLDTMNFSADLVNILRVKQLQELADWAMGNEPITAENVIQSINILPIANF